MNRLMLFAILVFQGTLVFSQSPATPPASPQTSGKASMGQWPFDFSYGRQRQTAASPFFTGLYFQGPNTTPNQTSAPIDFDHLFNAPDADLKTPFEFLARNENPFSLSPRFVQPQSKFEPIPTQWPNAKTEQIPTQWQNLKLQPIYGQSLGKVSTHGRAK